MSAPLQIVRPVTRALACSMCGAAGEANCDCGAPYMPASTKASKAVAEHPEKSDRAIAAEIGVSHPTVAKARRETTGKDFPVDTRVGLDGKVRRLPTRKPVDDDGEPGVAEPEEIKRNILDTIDRHAAVLGPTKRFWQFRR